MKTNRRKFIGQAAFVTAAAALGGVPKPATAGLAVPQTEVSGKIAVAMLTEKIKGKIIADIDLYGKVFVRVQHEIDRYLAGASGQLYSINIFGYNLGFSAAGQEYYTENFNENSPFTFRDMLVKNCDKSEIRLVHPREMERAANGRWLQRFRPGFRAELEQTGLRLVNDTPECMIRAACLRQRFLFDDENIVMIARPQGENGNNRKTAMLVYEQTFVEVVSWVTKRMQAQMEFIANVANKRMENAQ